MYNSQYLRNYLIQYLQLVSYCVIYIIWRSVPYNYNLQVMSFAGQTFKCPFVDVFPHFMH